MYHHFTHIEPFKFFAGQERKAYIIGIRERFNLIIYPYSNPLSCAISLNYANQASRGIFQILRL